MTLRLSHGATDRNGTATGTGTAVEFEAEAEPQLHSGRHTDVSWDRNWDRHRRFVRWVLNSSHRVTRPRKQRAGDGLGGPSYTSSLAKVSSQIDRRLGATRRKGTGTDVL